MYVSHFPVKCALFVPEDVIIDPQPTYLALSVRSRLVQVCVDNLSSLSSFLLKTTFAIRLNHLKVFSDTQLGTTKTNQWQTKEKWSKNMISLMPVREKWETCSSLYNLLAVWQVGEYLYVAPQVLRVSLRRAYWLYKLGKRWDLVNLLSIRNFLKLFSCLFP